MESSEDEYAAFEQKVSRTVYLDNLSPQCALVELDSAKKAKEVISMIGQYPFMMSGMPRPVRARPAVMEMFDDRPAKPNKKLKCCWLDPSDTDFEVAKEIKNLTRKHAAEIAFMHKLQLEEEEKLAKQQEDTLKGHYKKFKMIEGIMTDRTAHRLARKYNLSVADD
ncbi:ASI1-immunoprecipitated protein 1-like isoform X2 [Gastrolobium bilobum]|uniref:ASI1-immunoprecipitated protein 1-like isoform X2 n=1 Tax=Gastrolobium bilobum TaxID=150636 RepID=UPI002AB1285C|nr:ASI1-immunoprecipitated protein 1-like isoform X2 [Gastrolobium bilobum]